MERDPDSHAGAVAWAILGAAVVAYDLLAPESLTHSFERARTSENGLIRVAALGALAMTAGHLAGIIPRKYDLYYLSIDRLGRGKS